MRRKVFIGLLVSCGLAFIGESALAADPSLHQVYQAVEAGKLNEAQGMMDQVLHDHPNSAKAHYVEAEIMAKEGRLTSAQSELATAERLSPGLSFAKPEAVQALKANIMSSHTGNRDSSYSGPPATNHTPSFEMLLALGLGVLAFIVLVARWMKPRAAAPLATGGYSGFRGPAPGPQFANGGIPVAGGPASSGIGSGILGGLATGAAVGAGMVAGEALAHNLFDGHRRESNSVVSNEDNWISSSNNDVGGTDFGITDNSTWDNGGGGGDDWN